MFFGECHTAIKKSRTVSQEDLAKMIETHVPVFGRLCKMKSQAKFKYMFMQS